MSRYSFTHCKVRCRTQRCEALSKSSKYKKRCCLCLSNKMVDGKMYVPTTCRYHADNEGIPMIQIRGVGDCATVGYGVEVRQSNLPHAGNGLFAAPGWVFTSNDIITEYEGKSISRPALRALKAIRDPTLLTHIACIAGGHHCSDGIKLPVADQGGGSFANDPYGSRYKVNATIVEIGNVLYVKVKQGKLIKSNEEIFVNYGATTRRMMGIQ